MSHRSLDTVCSRKHLKRAIPYAIVDSLIMAVAYVVVYMVRIADAAIALGTHGRVFMLGAISLTIVTLYLFGGYNRIWSRTSGHDVAVIVNPMLLLTPVLLILDYPLRSRPVPLSVVIVGNAVATMGFVAVRYRSRLASGLSWRWRAIWHYQFPEPKTRVLIIGAGDAGQTTAWRLKHRAPHGEYDVVGFVDDDPEKQLLYIEGCQVLGTRQDIPHLVAELRVDLIVMAVHNIAGADFREILTLCEKTPARIKLVPDVFAHIGGNANAPLLRDIQPEDLLGRQTVEWHQAVDMAPVSGKVVMITGAAGSIGSELCRQMINFKPVRLIMLDNNESGLHDLYVDLCQTANCDHLVPVLTDITDRAAMERVFATYRPQVIFHSAAYKHVPLLEAFPAEAIRVNIGGTQCVATLARDYHAERFVLISTDKAVNPSSVMGASKRVCELLMQAYAQAPGKTRFTAVRFGNVLGSRGSVVPTFNRQIERGGPVTVTDKAMTRYFMTIPEAVNLVIHAACLTEGGDLFMLRMGEVVRIVELAERMIRLRGLRPYIDIPIEFTGPRPGEKLHEELHARSESTIPTVHPYIIELTTANDDFQAATFVAQVQQLKDHGLSPERQPLEQLQAILKCGGAPEHIRAAS